MKPFKPLFKIGELEETLLQEHGEDSFLFVNLSSPIKSMKLILGKRVNPKKLLKLSRSLIHLAIIQMNEEGYSEEQIQKHLNIGDK